MNSATNAAGCMLALAAGAIFAIILAILFWWAAMTYGPIL